MRIRVSLAVLGLVVCSAAIGAAQPSAAGPKPLRFGTIEGGTGAWRESGCAHAADCQAWLLSRCNPALAGIEPAVTASIVDVGSLANGRTRRTLYTTAPKIPPWGLWPNVVVQFWRQSCTEIDIPTFDTPGSGTRCRYDPFPAIRCEGLRIPRGAKWMTLSGTLTTAHLTWTLT